MLTDLNVRNMALIDREEVSFGDGLNIMSGETGAGKSILIGSVNVALASASFRDYIADETKDALVELVFETASPAAARLLAAAGIHAGETEIRAGEEKKAGAGEHPGERPGDGGRKAIQIILTRKFHAGRSAFRVNGETVPASFVKELSAQLIDIHGQHEHQSLLRASHHLTLLDRYAQEELGEWPERCAQAYAAWKTARRQLEEASLDENDRIKRADLLRYELREIEEAALEEGEDESLEEEYRRMSNGAKITQALAEAGALTGSALSSGEESASDLLSRAVRALLQVAGYDPKLEELAGQLSEVDDLLQDFDRALADYMASFTYDEQTFYETGRRLDLINHLKAKYGRSVAEVLAYAEDCREQLERLENHEAYIAQLEHSLKKNREELDRAAGQMSEIRRKKAKLLSGEITGALLDLNFPQVRFDIAFETLEEPTAKGCDAVCFMLSANPGMPLRPLQETASGGELSRIMLAIKSVMSEQDEVETLIFDEIDTGISGRTAQKVAEKMHAIAGRHQVLCITHLPQIAAMADGHYLIEKKAEEDGKAHTHIRAIGGDERVEELSRILGGARITDAIRESAAEMLRLAGELKG